MIRNRAPDACSCVANASPVGPAPTINASSSELLFVMVQAGGKSSLSHHGPRAAHAAGSLMRIRADD
jgi:hypothetical protein